jgi:sugar phosphate isomerase/epimerase
MAASRRKMKIAFTPGSIGVKTDQKKAIELAHHFGFEAVEPFPAELARLSGSERDDLLEELESKELVWAAAGLPIDFRADDSKFNDGMQGWPRLCQALRDAGASRVGTWLLPYHGSLTYLENFKQTATRLRQIALVARDYGLRLGLEYVGTKTLWTRDRFAFVHTMAETKELIAEIRGPNVGFVLDSWHWWTANETKEDILTLKNEDVVSCDLNDAPAGIKKELQIDGQRELPMATGMIDVKSFLEGLHEIGYDGPIRAEPFSAKLRAMPEDQACGATIEAMKKAIEPIE